MNAKVLFAGAVGLFAASAIIALMGGASASPYIAGGTVLCVMSLATRWA